jgi:murein L,D-transpeptidase YcbB/YkuD
MTVYAVTAAAHGTVPLALVQRLSPAAITEVQQRLKQNGVHAGQQALERFQQGQGLQANGQVNPATMQALGLDPNSLGTAPQPQR